MKTGRRRMRFERTVETLEGRELLSTASDWVHARLHKHKSHHHVAVATTGQTAQATSSTRFNSAAQRQAARIAARNGLPITIPENTQNPVYAQTPTTTFSSGSNSGLTAASAANIYRRALASYPGLLPGASAPAGTSFTVSPSSANSVLPTAPAATMTGKLASSSLISTDVAPAPVGPLSGVVLSKADVTNLQQAIDTFAVNYTSGTDATKDKAAVDALNASLVQVDSSLWSETHVADKASVAKLAQAMQSFASSYTSNSDATADKAAWNTLNLALRDFTSGLKNPAATTGSTTTNSGSTAPPPPDGVLMPMDGPQVEWMFNGLLYGPALTKDEVSTLKQSVDTFAVAYTSGADAAKDQTAVTAFQTSLDNLSTTYWNSQASTGSSSDGTAVGGAVPTPFTRTAALPGSLALNSAWRRTVTTPATSTVNVGTKVTS